jgi:hypothetical protein
LTPHALSAYVCAMTASAQHHETETRMLRLRAGYPRWSWRCTCGVASSWLFIDEAEAEQDASGHRPACGATTDVEVWETNGFVVQEMSCMLPDGHEESSHQGVVRWGQKVDGS